MQLGELALFDGKRLPESGRKTYRFHCEIVLEEGEELDARATVEKRRALHDGLRAAFVAESGPAPTRKGDG